MAGLMLFGEKLMQPSACTDVTERTAFTNSNRPGKSESADKAVLEPFQVPTASVARAFTISTGGTAIIGNCPEPSSRWILPADRSGKRPMGEACGPDTSRTPEVNKRAVATSCAFSFVVTATRFAAHVWAWPTSPRVVTARRAITARRAAGQVTAELRTLAMTGNRIAIPTYT